MQWHTQAGNITTNFKVKIEFTLPELRLIPAKDVPFALILWYVTKIIYLS